MRYGTNAKQRLADSRRHLRHGTKSVIEQIIEFENYRRGRRDIQTQSRARTIQIKIRNGAIESHEFVSHYGSKVGALVKFLREQERELVASFDVEAVLTRRTLSDKLSELLNRVWIAGVDNRWSRTLTRISDGERTRTTASASPGSIRSCPSM